MSPKNPLRPKPPKSSSENPTGRRDTTTDVLPGRPINLPGDQSGQTPGHRFPEGSHPLDVQPSGILISDLPPDTHISRIANALPITHYYLPERIVDRLPAPDPQSGIRSIVSGRQYVDLADGGTVALGIDAAGHFRAKQMTELIASGPRLERIEGANQWRMIQSPSADDGDSQLIITRHPLPEDEPAQPGPSKRPRVDEERPPTQAETNATAEPWINWAITSQQASPDDVTIAGIRYGTLPRGDAPNHPIVYIRSPAHQLYDFDVMHTTLSQDLAQQPRGVIQVPPANHWQIDPNLPFEKALPDYVATYFSDLTDVAQLSIAREQFSRANGSSLATGVGLTTLRQLFNDWKTSNIAPRPELADPLLMLPITPFSAGRGTARKVELTYLTRGSPLHRLEFDTHKFQREWDYYMTTQNGVDLKRFMATLLVRNGYTVFDPTPAQTYPMLVFGRAGHDFVFHMTLHRVRGNNINVPPTDIRSLSAARLLEQIGPPALQAVQNAQAAGKLIWLKGGSQVWLGHGDRAFIVRTHDPNA
ncbi:hypothetical protein PS918_04682 [Pseudomonas fluorescens]|uniref:Uncharacterized protein n=1 Tax=Pseudomonas fluorescens TaxID=294 RepID=A0A5E7U5R8_PSEFL|nr:hypothetical protein [Pseudomonas fluorescens]VVQ06090.1 hypothetical protein PS918_04682 [Pseudomonas fluorescens]